MSEELVTVSEVEALARKMWGNETLPRRVLRFGGAVLGLVDNALAARATPVGDSSPPVSVGEVAGDTAALKLAPKRPPVSGGEVAQLLFDIRQEMLS